jgi:hypothetical protein
MITTAIEPSTAALPITAYSGQAARRRSGARYDAEARSAPCDPEGVENDAERGPVCATNDAERGPDGAAYGPERGPDGAACGPERGTEAGSTAGAGRMICPDEGV